MEKLTGREITIAITVYDRQKYLPGAIRSALQQKTAEQPTVIVVEDCGPDPSLRESILGEFGNLIEYRRNPQRRGLFDNWNACIEACQTQWLCILHDDDFLEPTFVESMIELAEGAPGRALYYGRCEIIDQEENCVGESHAPNFFSSPELRLEEWATYDPVCFPAQLFNVTTARNLGGFRPSSHYTADWEFWFKLTLAHGSAGTDRILAKYRQHESAGRGTIAVDVSGRKYAYVNCQRKRNLALLRQLRPSFRFDRKALQQKSPMPLRFILSYGYKFSPWIFRYNAGLFGVSSSPSFIYRIFQILNRLFSWRSLWAASLLLQLTGFGSRSLAFSHTPTARRHRYKPD